MADILVAGPIENRDVTFWVAAGVCAAGHWNIDPDDLKVIKVPRHGTQFQVVYGIEDDTDPRYAAWNMETIDLCRFADGNGSDVWLGYGPRSKTLVVREPREKH